MHAVARAWLRNTWIPIHRDSDPKATLDKFGNPLLFVPYWSRFKLYQSYVMDQSGEKYDQKRNARQMHVCLHPDVFAREITDEMQQTWVDQADRSEWTIHEQRPHHSRARGFGVCKTCSLFDGHILNAPTQAAKQAARNNKRRHLDDSEACRKIYAENKSRGTTEPGVISIVIDAADQSKHDLPWWPRWPGTPPLRPSSTNTTSLTRRIHNTQVTCHQAIGSSKK